MLIITPSRLSVHSEGYVFNLLTGNVLRKVTVYGRNEAM